MKIIQITDVKLKGVGEIGLKKLLKGGITTVNALAMLTQYELMEYTDMGADLSVSVINQARDMIGAGFITGEELVERLGDQVLHSTGSTQFDSVIGGGLHSGVISEFSGEFGALKTQLCMTAAVICAATKGKVIVVDTEGTWGDGGLGRLKEIAESRGYDGSYVLRNMVIARAFNSEHMVMLVDELFNQVNIHEAKMVVVDSIISHFRSEYIGRGKLADRQGLLGGVVGKLLRVAKGFGIAMLFTNQVQAIVDNAYGMKFKPAGGHVLAHACTYRFLLFKGKKVAGDGIDYQTSIAHIYDTSSLPPCKTRIMCTEAGIVNEDGTYPEQVIEDDV